MRLQIKLEYIHQHEKANDKTIAQFPQVKRITYLRLKRLKYVFIILCRIQIEYLFQDKRYTIKTCNTQFFYKMVSIFAYENWFTLKFKS